MDFRIPPVQEFFPSTLEHRPLHTPEKVALKQYFEVSGADEYEGFTPSQFAIHPELADLEAWIWGMRLWGRETIVRAAAGATHLLVQAWEAGLAANEGDEVSLAALYGQILPPTEAISLAHYWANIPTEEKAVRLLDQRLPLPEAWQVEPLASALQAKPFFWGAQAAPHILLSIFVNRDPAAVLLAQVVCGAARVRMLAGRSPAAAVADVRETVILTLRKWMGRRW